MAVAKPEPGVEAAESATYQGRPCLRGHPGRRYKSTRGCVDCILDSKRYSRAVQKRKAKKGGKRVKRPQSAEQIKKRQALRTLKQPAERANPAQRELARRILARKHLLPFVVRHEPNYQAGWFHRLLCQKLEKFSRDVAEGKSPRLMIMCPPRAGKSTLASVEFPAWHLGQHPGHDIIQASYAASLATGFSRKVRERLRDATYKATFPKTKLDPDNQGAETWATTAGGNYLAAGVGGPATGRCSNCLIIDDFLKNAEDANSQATRDAQWDWYTSVAYTRLAPGGGVLILATRWNDDDLLGRLESKMLKGEGDRWEILKFPAIATEDEKYRKKGEALHPERYPLKALEKICTALGGPGSWAWEALYQQSPSPEEGGYFRKDFINLYSAEELPAALVYYAAWDLAIGKKDRNDYTVGITVGVDAEEHLWVVEMRRGHWDAFEIVNEIIASFRRFEHDTIGLEKGQIQMALGPYLDKRIGEEQLYRMNVLSLATGRRDKETRARAIQGRMRQGMVHVPKDAVWLGDFVNELLRFPHGAHDDIPDALAHVGTMLDELVVPRPPKEPPKKASWRDKLKRYVATNGRYRSPMSA